jgi:membrane protein
MNKKNSKRKKGLLVRSYENSLIISTLDAAGARLHRAVSGSAFARGFCFADRLDEAKDKSLICRAVTSSKANHFFSKIKTAFARLVESSGIVGAYRRGINGILCSQVRDIGVFLLSFGLFSLISTLLKAFMFDYVSDATELSFICVAAMLIISLPMLFSKRSVASKLSESAAFSSLLSGLLGISPLALRTKLTPRAHSAIALALGTVAGSLSFVFQPVNILWTVLLATGAMTVLYSPESGLLLAIILLPFAPYTAVRIVATASAVSYLLKLLRGKRNMSISATDSVVLLFAAACICAFGPGQAASLFAASLVYLLAVNLLRSSDLFEKGINALSVGLFLPSFFAATSSVCALFGVTLTDYIPAITFFESDSVAMITLVSAPVSLFALHKSKRRLTTVASLLFFISSTVNAVLSYSLPIWCGYAGILVVYGLFRLAKPLNTLFATLLAAPFAASALFLLYKNNDTLPFAYTPLFSDNEFVVRLIGGAAPQSTDSIMTAIASGGGILLLSFFAVTVLCILSKGFSAVYKTRLDSVRLFCGSLSALIVALVYITALPATCGDIRIISLAFCGAGLLSGAGNVLTRRSLMEDY